jgi:hypothetical protein
MSRVILLLSLMLFAGIAFTTNQQDSSSRHDEVSTRGDHVMGFSHDAASHHFRLFKDGGEIEVSANDPSDKPTIEAIRMHLGHIATMFSAGNFNAPMLIHDTNPPGVATMTRFKEDVRYLYSSFDRGARIRIFTGNSATTDAVHAFLLFQIIDHQTGDSPAIVDGLPKS